MFQLKLQEFEVIRKNSKNIFPVARTKKKDRFRTESVFFNYISAAIQDAIISTAIIVPKKIAVILVAFGGILSVSFSKAGKKKPITTKSRTSQTKEIGRAI